MIAETRGGSGGVVTSTRRALYYQGLCDYLLKEEVKDHDRDSRFEKIWKLSVLSKVQSFLWTSALDEILNRSFDDLWDDISYVACTKRWRKTYLIFFSIARHLEALDSHLTGVLRDHEQRSQIEEREIRNDIAFEEVKRKEKALQEERLHQEKVEAELRGDEHFKNGLDGAEENFLKHILDLDKLHLPLHITGLLVRLEAAKQRAEEAHKAALAERRAAKEVADREATETTKMISPVVARKEAMGRQGDVKAEGLNAQSKGSGFGAHKLQSAGNILKSAESALKVEDGRLQKFKELDEKNQTLRLSSKMSLKMEIKKELTTERLTSLEEAYQLVLKIEAQLRHQWVKRLSWRILSQNVSTAPRSNVVSQCENPSASFGSNAFACGHVIVLVNSQIPHAMDLILAEFHRACIYTVPKHINYSETEVVGIQNTHGLKEGWAWLARFLNALPANIYTAVALEAFLKMAGFALFRKYKSQFRKILNIISHYFLDALKARGDSKLNPVITRLKSYIETNQFLQEPEGWHLRTSLLSDVCVLESDSGFYQDQYH
ncbi:hypothetical protein HHK36_011739 [Tetracentron sinense]|uniref:mRNA export factor GLE1 n=1 Tax=Tetracentron sinense TaxID=13715 RepID=A0A834ZDI3_TETSI|nr:hypothetical protein HHK36_011739 [Tetracentron sinense]